LALGRGPSLREENSHEPLKRKDGFNNTQIFHLELYIFTLCVAINNCLCKIIYGYK
jgi:hypothetical protein